MTEARLVKERVRLRTLYDTGGIAYPDYVWLDEALAAAAPAEGLREALEYAAELAHHSYWDSGNQDGHSDRDWRKCSRWPCAALARHESAGSE